MKHIAIFTAAVTLAGCMDPVPSAPDGAISFVQLMAETQGRPFECVNYDRETDTCSTVSRFQLVNETTYRMTSFARMASDVPVLAFTVTMRDQNAIQCTDFEDVSVQVAGGETNLALEAALAQFEADIAQSLEPFCGYYEAAASGYVFTVVSGSPEALAEPPQRIEFFAQPKDLRLRE